MEPGTLLPAPIPRIPWGSMVKTERQGCGGSHCLEGTIVSLPPSFLVFRGDRTHGFLSRSSQTLPMMSLLQRPICSHAMASLSCAVVRRAQCPVSPRS